MLDRVYMGGGGWGVGGVAYRLKHSKVLSREASSNLKRSHRHSATHTAMPTTPLHHKSLFKSLTLYLHGSLYLISYLPSRMAYIQQEKAFRFSRIRIFRINITKASTVSQNLNTRIVVDLNVETFMGVLGDIGQVVSRLYR